jgi:hypothetical protein
VKSCIFIFVALSFSLLATGQAQGIVASASANNVKGGIALSWTIGQVAASTDAAAGKPVILPQSLPDKLIVNAIDDNSDLPVGLELYPNPACDILNIRLNMPVEGELVMAMLDSNGNLVKSDLMGISMTWKQINLKNIPSGIYYIRLIRGNVVKIYKVVKL